MIRVGTLCLLIGGHECEGATCTVTGPLAMQAVWYRWVVYDVLCYAVDIPSHSTHHAFIGWAARPCQLMPIDPPPLTVDERETVAIHA